MDIQSLESRNNGQDWPVIVQSVECPKCLAPEGSPCVIVGDPRNPMLVTGGTRGDWHAERKYAAASLWYQQQAINNP